jgi:hypothetical protein
MGHTPGPWTACFTKHIANATPEIEMAKRAIAKAEGRAQ